jgi:hypothetical protein
VDGLAEWYTDILGAGLAVKLGTGYVALKQSQCQDTRGGSIRGPRETGVSCLIASMICTAFSGPESPDTIPSPAGRHRAASTPQAGQNGTTSGLLSEKYTEDATHWQVLLDAALIKGSRVLLCATWVDRTEHLEAATRLLARAGAKVLGCVALRYDDSARTQEFASTVPIIARSRPSVACPPNGMSSSSPAVKSAKEGKASPRRPLRCYGGAAAASHTTTKGTAASTPGASDPADTSRAAKTPVVASKEATGSKSHTRSAKGKKQSSTAAVATDPADAENGRFCPIY